MDRQANIRNNYRNMTIGRKPINSISAKGRKPISTISKKKVYDSSQKFERALINLKEGLAGLYNESINEERPKATLNSLRTAKRLNDSYINSTNDFSLSIPNNRAKRGIHHSMYENVRYP